MRLTALVHMMTITSRRTLLRCTTATIAVVGDVTFSRAAAGPPPTGERRRSPMPS